PFFRRGPGYRCERSVPPQCGANGVGGRDRRVLIMAHFLTRKALSRRHLLRGTGSLLALPLLEAMLPAGMLRAQAAAAQPCRLGCLYFPHGATMSRWTPVDEGPDFTFSEILEPLEPFRQHLTVFSNLGLPLAYGPG